MSLERKIANYFERKIYGSGAFHTEAATLRTLIKFFDDHQSPVPPESALRQYLSALEPSSAVLPDWMWALLTRLTPGQ